MLKNSSTEKVTTRCLYCIMSLVLYKQKLSRMVITVWSKQKWKPRSLLFQFMAAHLYSIPSLMSKCGEVLINKLTIENAAEYFYKAYLTDNEDLKDAAAEFFSYNSSEVYQSSGWKELMKTSNAKEALQELLKQIFG